jgi:hypothetical protein
MTYTTRKIALILGLLCCANRAFGMDMNDWEATKGSPKREAIKQLPKHSDVTPFLEYKKDIKKDLKKPFVISTAAAIVGGVASYYLSKHPASPFLLLLPCTIFTTMGGLWVSALSGWSLYKTSSDIKLLEKPFSDKADWKKIRKIQKGTLEMKMAWAKQETDNTPCNKNQVFEFYHTKNNVQAPIKLNDPTMVKDILTDTYNTREWIVRRVVRKKSALYPNFDE